MPSRKSYSGDYNSEGGKNKSRQNKSRKMRGGLSGKDRNGVLYNDQFGNPRPTMRTPDGYIIVRR